jgi:hypothetical protein
VVAYTCPAGRTAILKDIRLGSTAAGASTYLVGLTSGPLTVRALSGTVPNGDVVGLQPYLVLAPGDALFVVPGILNGFNFWISGSELDGVAP